MTATTFLIGIVGLSFFLVWIVFKIIAKRFLDLDSVRKELSKKVWLKMLKPEIVQPLLTRGLPVIVAVFAASLVYRYGEPLANWLAWRFNPPQELQALQVSRDLLDLDISKLPVVGRDQELEELRRFTEGKPRVLWWWLTGNDSVGRNRLVHEWRTHLKGWDVGAPRFGIDESFCKAFQPRRPTALVVEDAAEHSRKIPLIIAALAACASDLSHPIRILLVEQSIPQALEVLNEETRYSRYRYRREPLELPTLGTDAVQSLAVAIERLSGKSVPLSANHNAALLEATGGQEFFVIIALHRLAETGKVEPLGTRTLLSEQSERLRTRFEHLGLRQSNIPLLILGTLVGGLPWKDAEPFAPKDGQLDRALCERLLHQNCYRAIPPIAPPVLGYAFVLDYFKRLSELEQRRIMEAAWRLAPERVAWTLAMMYVNVRAHPEFAHLNQRPEPPELLEPWAEAQATLVLFSWHDAHHKAAYLDVLSQVATAGGLAPQRILARGLVSALVFPQLDEVNPRFNELKRLAESQRADLEIQRFYAKGALNVMAFWLDYYGQLREDQVAYKRLGYDLDFDVQKPLYSAFQTLQDIAARFPDDVSVQGALARGVVNALQYLLAQGETPLDVLLEWERKLYRIVARFPKDPEIQLRRARALVYTMRLADQFPWESVEERIDLLHTTVEAFPDFPDFRDELKEGRLAAVVIYARGRRWDEMNAQLKTLEAAGAAHVAQALTYVVWTCGDQKEWSELSRALQRLAHLVDDNPEVYDVVEAYNGAVAYAIDARGRAKQWSPLQMTIESVSELTARHPSRPSIRRVLGTALERATDHLGDEGRLDEVGVAWKHLQELADRWPNDLELQRLLARGGVNVIIAYAKPLRDNPNTQDWKNFAQVWSVIENLVGTLANDPEVQRMAARAAVAALQEWLPAGRSAEIQRASEQLRHAAQRFPADRDIEKMLRFARDHLGFNQQ